MRILATWLTLAILLCGILVPCPACERAEAEKAPQDAHACCERVQADSRNDAGAQLPQNGDDCDRVALLAMLAAQESEQPVTTLLAAHHSLPNAIAALPAAPLSSTIWNTQSSGRFTPPDSLPSSPEELGTLVLPLRL